jgi:hypothetical protein
MGEWSRPISDADESARRLASQISAKRGGGREVENGKTLVRIADSIVPPERGVLFTGRIGTNPNNRKGFLVSLPQFGQAGYIKRGGDYWTTPIVRGDFYRVLITDNYGGVEGEQEPYFCGVVFRRLQDDEDSANPHILTPQSFETLKDISFDNIRSYSIESDVVEKDLNHLRMLNKLRGTGKNRSRRKKR